MGFRIIQGTVRPGAVTFTFDGVTISAYAGETVAAALLASDVRCFRRDTHDRPRAPYCNMGTCFECMVDVLTPAGAGGNEIAAGSWRSVRACLTVVYERLEVRSRGFTQTLRSP